MLPFILLGVGGLLVLRFLRRQGVTPLLPPVVPPAGPQLPGAITQTTPEGKVEVPTTQEEWRKVAQDTIVKAFQGAV